MGDRDQLDDPRACRHCGAPSPDEGDVCISCYEKRAPVWEGYHLGVGPPPARPHRALYERVAVTALREGDIVDLEGDPYADPDRDHPAFPYELALVLGGERETEDCHRVDFDHDAVGFPPQHHVYRAARGEGSSDAS